MENTDNIEEVIDKFSIMVFRLAFARVNNSHDANDMINPSQETLEELKKNINNNKLKSSKVKIFVPLVAALVLIPLAFGIFSKIKNTNSNYDNNVSVLSENSKIKEIYNYEETVDNSVESTNKDFTDTNVQVQGVQEADIIKADGDYIYYLEEI